MATFAKPFRGVKAGEIYPSQFQAGDPCPPELEAAARAVGALQQPKEPPKRRGKE